MGPTFVEMILYENFDCSVEFQIWFDCISHFLCTGFRMSSGHLVREFRVYVNHGMW